MAGSMMVTMEVETHELADEFGHIRGQLSCLECGYDLRMLEVSGACPECGTPVRVSMRADGLGEAEEGYRKSLVTSTPWLIAGVASSLVLLYVGLAIAMVGIWQLTRKEPDRHEPKYDGRLRLLARVGIGLGLTGSLVGFGMGLVIVLVDVKWAVMFEDWEPVDVVLVTLHGAMFLGTMALWEYVSILGKRLKDHEIVVRCRRMRWVWVIGLTLICSLALGTSMANLFWSSQWVQWRWAYQEAHALVPMGIVVAILFWIWFESLRFMLMLRGKLKSIVD